MSSTAAGPFSSRIVCRRFLVALLVLPFADATLGFTAYPVVWWIGDRGARMVEPSQGAGPVAVLSGVLGLFVMIAAAAPVTGWLYRRGRTSIRDFTLAGAVVGNLPFAAYLCFVLAMTVLHFTAGTLREHLSSPGQLLAGGAGVLFLGSVLGGASGAMFWLLAICHDQEDEGA